MIILHLLTCTFSSGCIATNEYNESNVVNIIKENMNQYNKNVLFFQARLGWACKDKQRVGSIFNIF